MLGKGKALDSRFEAKKVILLTPTSKVGSKLKDAVGDVDAATRGISKKEDGHTQGLNVLERTNNPWL